MKIQKRTIKACEDVTCDPVVETCQYQNAIDSIMCAIECLGAVATNDPIARESIANLSVVLFDLKTENSALV